MHEMQLLSHTKESNWVLFHSEDFVHVLIISSYKISDEEKIRKLVSAQCVLYALKILKWVFNDSTDNKLSEFKMYIKELDDVLIEDFFL